MFSDNKSVINSSILPYMKIQKRYVALSFYIVRESIASKMIGFYFIPSDINTAKILSKHCNYSKICSLVQPVLFCKGDTLDLLEKTSTSNKRRVIEFKKF